MAGVVLSGFKDLHLRLPNTGKLPTLNHSSMLLQRSSNGAWCYTGGSKIWGRLQAGEQSKSEGTGPLGIDISSAWGASGIYQEARLAWDTPAARQALRDHP